MPEQLQPRPDTWTGEPRPPRAPGFFKGDKPPKDQDSERDRSQWRKPSPPPGQGPVLEWYRHSRRYAIGMGVADSMVIGILIGFRQGFDYDWLSIPWMWLFLSATGLGMYGTFRLVDPAVGVDWLKVGRAWVLLYELTDIKVRHRGMSMHLDLKDSGVRKVQVKVDELQEDRDMWDIVYNGLLHSVVTNGATTNWAAHSFLWRSPKSWSESLPLTMLERVP
ncbi:hypothetical protein [Actinopolyspora mortivallis]|uniref:hypothetical protein n=1 Tax=Actinopolyspora mortivallis TaxID=33906 RepID=UPI001FDF296A|nr:hypothetical protein [Actinopolyspora mortivallis]